MNLRSTLLVPRRWRLAVATVAALAAAAAPAASAAPAAYAERAFSVAGSYAFGGSFGASVAAEFPVALPLPGDYSVALDLRYAGFFATRATAKVLLFPALGGTPPIALAFALNADLAFPAGTTVFRVGLGPIVSVDFEPLVLSLSAFPSFGSGGVALEAGLNARYYLDPVALDLSFDYSTFGVAAVSFGARYLF